MTWVSILALVEPILLVFVGIGGYIGLRSGMAKAETEVQERVRTALHDENELLQSRVKRLETENKRLGNLMELVVVTLKKAHGIELEIDSDFITLRTPGSSSVSQVSRLQSNSNP